MIKYISKDFKSLIINYNYFERSRFKIKIKSGGGQIIISDITVLLFINMEHNTVMKVDYYYNKYFDCKINLVPKLNYTIIFSIYPLLNER